MIRALSRVSRLPRRRLATVVAAAALPVAVVVPAAVAVTYQTWPGGSSAPNADKSGYFGTDLSGLKLEAGSPDVLWAVDNGDSTLYKLKLEASTGNWVPFGSGWTGPRKLTFPSGSGNPDAEGVTITADGSAAGIYVASERNDSGSASKTSRPSILKYIPDNTGGTLTAVREWNLTSDLPGLDENGSLESVAWIPDNYLTGAGFKDQRTGAAYQPSSYPNHGSGLFATAVEDTGTVYLYALDQTSSGYTRVASFSSGLAGVMDLAYDDQTSKLWAMCDDTCDGHSTTFTVSPSSGNFTAGASYKRPSGLDNLNDEGFTIAPRTRCVNGSKTVLWSDDSDKGNHALHTGTLTC